MTADTKQLLEEFSEVSAKQWKQKIQFDLKGKDFNETLIWHSLEGVDVKPFYSVEDLENKLKIPSVDKWSIQQSFVVVDEEKSNTEMLKAIDTGLESVKLILPSPIDFELLLKNFPFDRVSIYCYPQFLRTEYLASLQQYLGKVKSNGGIVIDIIGNLTVSGNWFASLKEDHSFLDDLFKNASDFPVVFGVNIGHYQNAGATIVQQLAYGIAHLNEYLNHLENLKTDKSISFIFDVSYGSNYFFEIAKTRAFRVLIEKLFSAYDLTFAYKIVARPSKRNKTLYDYNVNMLRTTTECMSAILGGADFIENIAYDVLFKESNDFGERIARNQLLVLKEESYFDKVKNPADGSYYIEYLTTHLAEKALSLFKSIEAGGGFLVQLKNHTIQKKIKESAAKEQALFDQGDLLAVGTNIYPNNQDQMKLNMEVSPFQPKQVRKTLIEPIFEKRLSEQLELERLDQES